MGFKGVVMLVGVDKIMWVKMERLFGLIYARSHDHASTWLRMRAGVHSARYVIWYMRALCHAWAGLLL